MKISLLGSTTHFFASGCSLDVPEAWRKCLENRFQLVKRLVVGSDHQTVTALDAPDTAARSGIDVVNALLPQFRSAADIILVKAVAAVNDRVAFLHCGRQGLNGCFRCLSGRNHDPHSTRLRKFLDEVLERTRAFGTLAGQLLYIGRVEVKNRTVVTAIL